MHNSVLVKYGEIALRGKNREKYEIMLLEQIRKAVGKGFVAKREQGRFLIICDEADIERVIRLATKIPGIHSACPCAMLNQRKIEDISSFCVSYVKAHHPACGYTFKVKTKRADKSYPLTSNEISAIIGEAVLESCGGLSVNVNEPDFTLNVELRSFVYIFSKEVRGFGGLPVSSSGRALCLLSGGIDSPVAAFQTAKRGVYTELVYFHSPPYVANPAKQKVLDLAHKISEYIGETKLYIVNFTGIQEYLRDNVPEDKLTVFMKRSMLAIAEMIARRERLLALVVGDSVGQVASQTIHAINAIDDAADMPVLRPLAGNNKQETVDLAKKLDTFDISIRPFEDCCTLFVPKHPETKPKKSVIKAIERSLDSLQKLREEAFGSIETVYIRPGEQEGEADA